MSDGSLTHHTLDRFRENTDDYTTSSNALRDRFVETGQVEIPGRTEPRRLGFFQYRIGDCAAIHLSDPLPWTLIEVRIDNVIGKQRYRVAVVRFDRNRQTVGGVSIGDLIDLPDRYFYAVWSADETREDGEGPHKVHPEGTITRPRD